MKASKLIVLVGGLLGILAFFLPMVSVTRDHRTVTLSAFQVVRGIDAVDHELDTSDVSTASLDDRAKLHEARGSINGIVLAVFAPALLLAVIGGLGVMRKRFGRGAGTLALLLGAIGLGIGAILKSAAEGDGGIGLTLLLVTGVAGAIGGLMALVKPERAAAVA